MWFSVGQSGSLLQSESQTSLGAQKESYSNSLCVSEAAKLWCLWVHEELFHHSGCCQPGEISLCISTSLLPAGLFHSRIILIMVFQIGVLPICSSELLCCRISAAFNKICHVWGGVFSPLRAWWRDGGFRRLLKCCLLHRQGYSSWGSWVSL